MEFKMAIVDECGEVMAWLTDLTKDEACEMLEQNPEWKIRPIQM